MSIKIKLNNDWVDTNIQAVRGVNHVNSEDVYTKEETEKKFATKTEVQTQINNSITKENIENIIGEVYTKQESDALFSDKVSKSDIVQSTGESTTSVMSQNAVSDAIKKKLNITDFNTFKADNTKTLNALDRNVSQNGSEIQEVNGIVQNHTDAIATLNTSIAQKADKTDIDTINAKVDKKVSKTDIVQNTGQSTTSVMSQKASTDSFIANTPSGDPAHFLYERAGAKWNADTGLWTLGSYSDLTTEEIRYAFANKITYSERGLGLFHDYNSRCIFPLRIYGIGNAIVVNRWFSNSKIREFHVNSMNLQNNIQITEASDYAFSSSNLVKISCELYISSNINKNSLKTLFSDCKKLEYIRVHTTYDGLYLNDSPLLSKESVLSMINGSDDEFTITHTLHPDVYAKCVDGGEWSVEIQAALANKTNVSLAEGE